MSRSLNRTLPDNVISIERYKAARDGKLAEADAWRARVERREGKTVRAQWNTFYHAYRAALALKESFYWNDIAARGTPVEIQPEEWGRLWAKLNDRCQKRREELMGLPAPDQAALRWKKANARGISWAATVIRADEVRIVTRAKRRQQKGSAS